MIASHSLAPISRVVFGKEFYLASMVGMIVADAHIFDLIGLDVDLGQLIDHADLWRNIGCRHRMTGIPQHIFVAVLDDIATEDELNLQAREGIRIREALIDDRWFLWCAAIEAGQRYLCRLCRCRETGDEQAGAEREPSQYSIHCLFSAPYVFPQATPPMWHKATI